jgi:hypothetical protein
MSLERRTQRDVSFLTIHENSQAIFSQNAQVEQERRADGKPA